ncbi:MAG: CHAT domain-containing protein [Thermodesulfobacteriota bacterium]
MKTRRVFLKMTVAAFAVGYLMIAAILPGHLHGATFVIPPSPGTSGPAGGSYGVPSLPGPAVVPYGTPAGPTPPTRILLPGSSGTPQAGVPLPPLFPETPSLLPILPGVTPAPGPVLQGFRTTTAGLLANRMSLIGAPESFINPLLYDPLGSMRRFLEELEQARGSGNVDGEIASLSNLGQASLFLGLFDQSEGYYRAVAELERKRANLEGEASALRNIGAVNNARGRFQVALENCRQALELLRNAATTSGQAEILNNIGTILKNADSYVKAVEAYTLALAQYQEADETRALIMMNLANAHRSYANYEEAQRIYEELLSFYTSEDQTEGLVKVLSALAATLSAMGNGNEALRILLQYVDRFSSSGRLPKSADSALPRVAPAFAERLGAATNNRVDLPRLARVPMAGMVGSTHVQTAHGHKGSTAIYPFAEADCDNRSSPRAKNLNGSFAEVRHDQASRTASDVGFSFAGLLMAKKPGREPPPDAHSRPAESQDRFVKQLKKLIGDLLLEKGDLNRSHKYLTEAGFDSSLGLWHLAKNDLRTAERHFRRLFQTARKSGDIDSLFVAYTGLGMVREAAHDLPNAESNYLRAVSVVEEIRASALPVERKNFFAGKTDVFRRSAASDGLVRVRMKRKKWVDSIPAVESARNRGFVDNLSSNVDLMSFKIPQDVRNTDLELQNMLVSFERARDILPREKDPRRYNIVAKQVAELKSETRAFVRMLRAKYPDYALVRHPEPARLQDLPLGATEHVIILTTLDDGVAATHIRGKKVIDGAYIPWAREELVESVAELRRPFEQVRFKDFNVRLANRIYDRLLARFVSRIPKGDPIILIPDGVLALVPFEALVIGGEPTWKHAPWGEYPTGLDYLGDAHPISYHQSLTSLAVSRVLAKQREPAQRVLIFADPVFDTADPRAAGTDQARSPEPEESHIVLMGRGPAVGPRGLALPRLAQTSSLAGRVHDLFRNESQVYTGLEANKDIFVKRIAPEIRDFGTVIFATHGLVRNDLPGVMEPALALTRVPQGRDWLLTMTEITDMGMNADLAVLTACQTAVGRVLSGEGVMSLGRAFRAAGARTVIMSLWSVAEDASVEMMASFFEHLKSGSGKLEAWRSAREDIRKKGYDHPFFWAPFILVGEAQ